MYEVLKLLHVLGWASWLGLAIAEASAGAQVRRSTDAGGKLALARLWARVGRIELMTMALAVLFGLALFAYDLSTSPTGAQGFMQQKAYLFVHIMLALGILGGVLALLAAKARGEAVAALEGGNADGFSARYKRAAMFSGMMALCLVATVVEVYLRSM